MSVCVQSNVKSEEIVQKRQTVKVGDKETKKYKEEGGKESKSLMQTPCFLFPCLSA